MKITYDHRTDTLTFTLRDGVAVAESDEDKPGVILDYDAAGDLVSLEVLTPPAALPTLGGWSSRRSSSGLTTLSALAVVDRAWARQLAVGPGRSHLVVIDHAMILNRVLDQQ